MSIPFAPSRTLLFLLSFFFTPWLPALTVTPSSTTVNEGTKQQFTATAASTWTTNCGSITSNGLLTAPLYPKVCTITATSGGVSATAKVTVVSPITMSPVSAQTPQWGTQQFTASAPVRWVAKCGSISASGLYSATAAAGSTCTVEGIASSGPAYTVYGYDAIQKGSAFTVSPGAATLSEGGTQQFTASSAATYTASCGTIGASSGVYTAPLAPGSCTVTATDSSGRTANATASVTSPISITPASGSLPQGETQQFTASVPVTWAASCGTVSTSGFFTAPTNIYGNTCTVTATASGSPAYAANANETITRFFGLSVFGDSTACGVGSSDYSGDPSSPTLVNLNHGYAYLLGPAFNNLGYRNYCHSGDQVYDTFETKVLPNTNPGASSQPVSLVVIGINDASREASGGYCNAAGGCRSNFQHALQAIVGWLAIPSTNKVFAQNCAVTSGSWTPNSAQADGVAIGSRSNSANAQLSCTVTTAGSLVVAWDASDQAANATHAMALAIDGAQVDTLSEAGFSGQQILTWHSTATAQFANIYHVAAGTHTVTFSSLCTDGCTVTPAWVGAPPPSPSSSGPKVVVGGILHQQNGTNDSVTSAYDTICYQVAQAFGGMGLAVMWADNRSAVNTSTDMHDQLHPNDTGHQHESNAVAAVIQALH